MGCQNPEFKILDYQNPEFKIDNNGVTGLRNSYSRAIAAYEVLLELIYLQGSAPFVWYQRGSLNISLSINPVFLGRHYVRVEPLAIEAICLCGFRCYPHVICRVRHLCFCHVLVFSSLHVCFKLSNCPRRVLAPEGQNPRRHLRTPRVIKRKTGEERM